MIAHSKKKLHHLFERCNIYPQKRSYILLENGKVYISYLNIWFCYFSIKTRI